MDLDPAEIRVLGALLEKQRTTPDAYPLSLNALRLACNQSTNRDPVVNYDDTTIREALHRLGRRRWTRLASGGRTAKYRHLLDDALPLDRGEHAVMCALMLRGPQTPGELKQRSERMHVFDDLGTLRLTLDRLIDRGLVRRLDRRPGHKEERYLQLLGDPDAAEPTPPTGGRPGERSAVAASTAAAERSAVATDQPSPDHRVTAGARAGHEGTGADDRPSLADTALIANLADRLERLEREVADLRAALGG